MSQLEKALINTRKTVLEVCTDLDIQYPPDVEIQLKTCSSCGIWLVKMPKDLDGLDTCNLCLDTYGY